MYGTQVKFVKYGPANREQTNSRVTSRNLGHGKSPRQGTTRSRFAVASYERCDPASLEQLRAMFAKEDR